MAPSTVLLLLDVQANFFEGNNPIPDARSVADTIKRVIDQARQSVPPPRLVWVRNCGDVGDPDQPNSRGWQLYFPTAASSSTSSSSITPTTSADEHIVDKTRNNAFDRNLLDALIPTNATLVVVGLQSEYDVKYTCYSGLDRGNHVVLVKGAHGTFHTEDERAGRIQNDVEIELDDAGVDVVDVESLSFRGQSQ